MNIAWYDTFHQTYQVQRPVEPASRILNVKKRSENGYQEELVNELDIDTQPRGFLLPVFGGYVSG
jgi:hypothetical protein